MSLYRKYRPLGFADVCGQEHVVTTLEKAASQGKLASAYLFAGSRGTGKTSVARILAKILMIRDIDDETLQQQICKGVEDGSIVDLLEIDAASNRGIDDVRDLIEKIQFSPVVASAKVYIIDEAHMLTKEAFNALLKTLEEPPPYAFFILATTELQKIPTTIQSRCQCFPFRHIREEDIVRRLQYIVDQERITIDREALRTIARYSEGSLRDAISLLDQLRTLPKITRAEVEKRVGTTGHEFVEALFSALEEGDREAVLQNVAKVEEVGVPLDIFTRELLRLVRGGLHKAIEQKLPTGQSIAMIDILLGAIRDMRSTPVPGLVLESALLSLCQSEEKSAKGDEEKGAFFGMMKKKTEDKAVKSAEPAKAAKDIAEKEVGKKMKEEKDEKKEPTKEADEESETADEAKEEKAEEAATKSAAIEAPDVSLETVRSVWPEIVAHAKPASVKMSLKNGIVTQANESGITLTFSSTFHKEKVAETDASRTIEETVEKIFKRHLKLHCTIDKAGADTEEQEEAVSLADAAKEIF